MHTWAWYSLTLARCAPSVCAYMLNCGWGDLHNCQPIDAALCWQDWMKYCKHGVDRIGSKHVNKNADMYAYKRGAGK